ncbi:helicase Sen1 [Flagelloscypha sp. PMI_526]|nr:helicase Sen1 [Flagelloscypha sp. PMI_526]
MMHENLSLRLWARNQCTHITRLPIPTSAITKIHRDLLLTVAFGPPGRLDDDKASSQKRVLPFFSTFPFCHDPLVLWQVFQVTLRFLPSECIVRRTEKGEDVRTIVYQHLSDDGDHFPGVLQCFLVLLNQLGPECWKGLEQFPLPVLDRIKDNPSFLSLIAAPIDQERQFRYLSWFEKYLTSVFEMPSILNEALPRIAQFMIGDLQHTRFANATPRVMTAFCAILSNLEGKRTSDSAFTTSLADTITIHAKDIVNVAFGTRQERTTMDRGL